MRGLIVCFYVLSSVVLHADPFTSASVTFPNGCPTGELGQSATGTTSAAASVTCSLDNVLGSSNAAAQQGDLSVGAGVEDSGTVLVNASAEARYLGTAPMGLDVFTFHLTGDMFIDGSASELVFTISSGTASYSETLHVRPDWTHSRPIDELFITNPLLVADGNYTADLIGTATGAHNGSGGGNLEAVLLDIQNSGQGEEVPEPGSFILLGSALIVLMLLRQRQREAA